MGEETDTKKEKAKKDNRAVTSIRPEKFVMPNIRSLKRKI